MHKVVVGHFVLRMAVVPVAFAATVDRDMLAGVPRQADQVDTKKVAVVVAVTDQVDRHTMAVVVLVVDRVDIA